MEVCSWMYFPFPLLKLGYVVPRPLRDFMYQTVSNNRKEWFGTQPLEKSFTKQLCPYIAFRQWMGEGAASVKPAPSPSPST